MERFTSEDAFDASEEGDAIMITTKRAQQLIEREHGCSWQEFSEDQPHLAASPLIDAAQVLAWLGY